MENNEREKKQNVTYFMLTHLYIVATSSVGQILAVFISKFFSLFL